MKSVTVKQMRREFSRVKVREWGLPFEVTADGEIVAVVVAPEVAPVSRTVGKNILSAEATAELLKKREIEKQGKGSATEVKREVGEIPWYDAAVHKAGDKVRMTVKGQVRVMTVPELDADGHFIPK